ncbi:toxin-antitoxin system YwqK family antitoxin [Mesohalobacter salilacus]|uniref:toxin-antitoxin system YwqK family antitoxin n=1 Tax=Mesohalobacter salilacus TaxID=2491711 RepID=UPI002691EA16
MSYICPITLNDKTMRTMMIIAACLFGGMLFAQESNVEYFKKGDLVKGIFYYDNGVIQQEGTYKNGKLHGQWIAYDRDGKKNAVAYYHKGQKTGKWFFWQKDKLVEVDYNYNDIANVKTYKSENVYAIEE